MTLAEKKMLQYVKFVGADLGQLDILVEDIKCQQATLINQRGTLAQVKYLLQHHTPEELKRVVNHEVDTLRKHQMKLQSKARPERNVKIKPKRRREA